jgi:AbrB family looped-hinge helix DNA binding protein
MATSTLTTKGQTTIPKGVREFLGLRPGDRLDFVIEGGKVVLEPSTADVRELKGILHREGREPVTVEAMADAVRRRAAKGGA